MASDDEWRHLLDSSKNLAQGVVGGARINRTLKGIQKEAHRLSSARAHNVSATQLYVLCLNGSKVSVNE